MPTPYDGYTSLTDAANGMVAKDGTTPYKRRATPTPPVTHEGQQGNKVPHSSSGAGDATPDNTPATTFARDTDRRKHQSDGTKING